MVKKLIQLSITYRPLIERIALIMEWGLVALLLVGAWQIQQQTLLGLLLYELGLKAGEVALILYLGTLLPGIAKRMGWVVQLVAAVMPYRRHLGIMMFWLAIIHYAFVFLLPIAFGQVPFYQTVTTTFGLLTLLMLLPLWLTSNDTSLRRLGRFWKVLHRLTYVALLLLFGHVAVQLSKWLFPTLIVIGMELVSWSVYWRRQRQRARLKSIVTPEN